MLIHVSTDKDHPFIAKSVFFPNLAVAKCGIPCLLKLMRFNNKRRYLLNLLMEVIAAYVTS